MIGCYGLVQIDLATGTFALYYGSYKYTELVFIDNMRRFIIVIKKFLIVLEMNTFLNGMTL